MGLVQHWSYVETSSLVLNDGKMVIEITTFNMDQKSSISNVRKGAVCSFCEHSWSDEICFLELPNGDKCYINK